MMKVMSTIFILVVSLSLVNAQYLQINTNSNTNVGQNTETILLNDLMSNNITLVTNLDVEWDNNNQAILVRGENGVSSDTSISPDQALIIAQTNTGSSCDGDCEIELNMEQENGNEQLIYEVETEKQVRVFGFIDADMKVETQIDARTGEVRDVDRSWWYFLATDTDLETSGQTSSTAGAYNG